MLVAAGGWSRTCGCRGRAGSRTCSTDTTAGVIDLTRKSDRPASWRQSRPHQETHHVRLRIENRLWRVGAFIFTCTPARAGPPLPPSYPPLVSDMANDYEIDATELLETYGQLPRDVSRPSLTVAPFDRLSHEIYCHRCVHKHCLDLIRLHECITQAKRAPGSPACCTSLRTTLVSLSVRVLVASLFLLEVAVASQGTFTTYHRSRVLK